MYYFSVPPFLYHQICQALLAAREHESSLPPLPSSPSLSRGSGRPLPIQDRYVLEKPFGKDTESCAQVRIQLIWYVCLSTYKQAVASL